MHVISIKGSHDPAGWSEFFVSVSRHLINFIAAGYVQSISKQLPAVNIEPPVTKISKQNRMLQSSNDKCSHPVVPRGWSLGALLSPLPSDIDITHEFPSAMKPTL